MDMPTRAAGIDCFLLLLGDMGEGNISWVWLQHRVSPGILEVISTVASIHASGEQLMNLAYIGRDVAQLHSASLPNVKDMVEGAGR